MKKVPAIFSLLTYTPSKLRRVDFVADDYIKNVSVIKQAEQSARGTSERIEIRSLDSKTPDQFRDRVLKNPDNKSRIVELIFEYITEDRASVMKIHDVDEINLSAEGQCRQVTIEGVTPNENLHSNQPEADTRVILHAVDALQRTDSDITIISPSGDTDIIVLVIAHLWEYKERVAIVNGSGKNRNVYKLGDVEIEGDIRSTIIGLHAFTGYVFFIIIII